MDAKQMKMVQLAKELGMKTKEKKNTEEEAMVKCNRKTVFEAIMKLTDTVAEPVLQKLLPFLDVSSWGEVAEERFIAHLCGFALCDKKLEKEDEKKMYTIDRLQGKIFESSHSDRFRFCGRLCWERFELIGGQLSEEPLWITARPKEMKYVLTAPIVPTPPRRSLIEIVPEAPLVHRMNDLFVAERDGQSSEDEEGEKDEREDDIKEKDRIFLNSIHRYCGGQSGGGVHKSKDEKMEISSEKKKKEERSEEERMAAVRERLNSKKIIQRRPVLLTEAQPLNEVQLKHETSSRSNPIPKAGPSTSATITEEKELGDEPLNGGIVGEEDDLRETIPFTGPWELPARLFVDWLNRRTMEMIRMGGRRAVSEMDRFLRSFYAGDRANIVETEDVVVPLVDKIDVRKRRIEIMMRGIRQCILSLESHLQVRSSMAEDFHSIVATLSLEADSITGWSKRETRVIVLGLWRIVCMLSDELEEDFFPNQALGQEIRNLLEFWQLEDCAYERLCLLIKGRLNMYDGEKRKENYEEKESIDAVTPS